MATHLSKGVRSRFNFFKNLKFPEKWKGGRLEKLAVYWRSIYQDYRDVAVETIADMKTKPKKTAAIFTGLTLFSSAMVTKPDKQHFDDSLIKCNNDLLQLSDAIRNAAADEHIRTIHRLHNEGALRHYNVGIVSLMWRDNYDERCNLFKSQCNYLMPRFAEFFERIVDVGFMGRWIFLESTMKDFDVNPREWEK